MHFLIYDQCKLIGRVLLAGVIFCALAATATAANPWIDMGVKDDFAFDQPQVSFELFENDGSGTSIGPNGADLFGIYNQFLLDTGATSIIAMNDALTNMNGNGYVTENEVLEQGVSGFSVLDVSAPYTMELTDSVGSVVSLPDTRIMSEQFPALFGINGIVGMPAMVGRVVSLDETVWTGIETFDDLLDADPMKVSFSSALPASNGHRYSVPIWGAEFDVIGEEPLPTSAPIPMLDMSVGFGNQDASGSFILDTGAQISFISSEIATQIGLDSNDDGVLGSGDDQFQDTLPIGGIGGTIEAPVFLIDRFSLATEQNVDLVWNLESLLSVLVVDIHPDIDGVLGSDLLTSGWIDLNAILGGGELDPQPGPVEQVHFDFRNLFQQDDTGNIYFDLTPSVDVLIEPETMLGDFNSDGVIDTADYTLWRDTYGSTTILDADANGNLVIDDGDLAYWEMNFGADDPGDLPRSGDFNGDGKIDGLDYTLWQDTMGSTTNLDADANGNLVIDEGDYLVWKHQFGGALGGAGAGAGGGAVPEPSSVMLLLVAFVSLCVCRRATNR